MKKYEIPIHVFGIGWVFCFFWTFFVAPSIGIYTIKVSGIIFIVLTVLTFISVVYAEKSEKIAYKRNLKCKYWEEGHKYMNCRYCDTPNQEYCEKRFKKEI